MVVDEALPWALEGFIERLDEWIERENPSVDLRLLTTAWVMTRTEDPYAGVRREPDFDNLWFGPVPRTVTPEGTVVACSYWIFETAHVVRCDSVATLTLPL